MNISIQKKNFFSTLISYDCIQRHIVILLHNSVQPKVGFDFRPIAVHLLIHDLTLLCESQFMLKGTQAQAKLTIHYSAKKLE